MASSSPDNDAMVAVDPPYNRYEAAAVFFIARWHTLEDATYTIEQAMKQAEFSDTYSNNTTLQERVRRIVLKKLKEMPGNEASSPKAVIPCQRPFVVPVSFVETKAESSPMSQVTEPSPPRPVSTSCYSYYYYSTRLDDGITQRCHKHSKQKDQAIRGKENRRDPIHRNCHPSEKVRLHKLAMKALVSGGKNKAGRTRKTDSKHAHDEADHRPS